MKDFQLHCSELQIHHETFGKILLAWKTLGLFRNDPNQLNFYIDHKQINRKVDTLYFSLCLAHWTFVN